MTIAQQIEMKAKLQGKVEGESIGLVKGELASKKMIALKLLQNGMMDDATISQLTELSLTEVHALRETLECI